MWRTAGAAADATMYPNLFGEIFGLKFKVSNGNLGQQESVPAIRPAWLTDHKIKACANILSVQTVRRKTTAQAALGQLRGC